MGVNKSLKKVFVNFLLRTILGLVFAICIPVVLFYFLVIIGEVNWANASETEAYAAVEEIKKTNQVEKILEELPSRIKYIRLDRLDKVISTSMSTEEKEDTFMYLRNQEKFDNGIKRYISLVQNQEKIILYYKIETYFTNSYINQILPSPEKIFIMIALFGIIVNFIIQVNCLERKFRKELKPILKSADEIGKQNLDYEIEPSKIKEFDEIQNALTDMKVELTDAFQKQWDMQRTQKEQIAALAHDLKTPLTVIMGNLDLLGEMEIGQEQKELVDASIEGLVNMEKYIQTLVEVAVSSIQYKYKFRKFSLAEFEKQIVKQSIILCQAKKIEFLYENLSDYTKYSGDQEMLERAVMNVIRNAVEYTPIQGKIVVQLLTKDTFLCIQISDSGEGFSEKMLHQGVKLFRMEDESRNGEKKHYGIGLYFVEAVAKKHGGRLELSNSEKYGGARIEIFLK